MKKQILMLSLTAVSFVFAGCTSTRPTAEFPPIQPRTREPEQITLKTIGPAGQSFAGTLTVDGSRQEISGVTPAEYPLKCAVLVGEVTKTNGDGTFGFQITRAGDDFYTPLEDSVCRFRYHDRTIEVFTKR